MQKEVQVGLVIRGRYVPLFWITNNELEDKKTCLARNLAFLLILHSQLSEFTETKTADNNVYLYCPSNVFLSGGVVKVEI